MTTAEFLQKVDDLLSEPKRWTKDTRARDRANRPVTPSHPKAACWCLDGAMFYLSVTHYDAMRARLRSEAILESLVRSTGVAYSQHDLAYVRYNDAPDTTFEDVKSLLKTAISEASALS